MKKRIRRYMRDGHRRSFFRRFVSILACVVVFCTTYALLLPAITLEKTAACGIEEHQHDDSCYENKLTCGLKETEGHSHSEDCYDIHSQIICKIEEHAHTGDCFDKNGNLTCALEEHTHDSGCFREDRVLSCKKEEAEPHHHSDACYEKVLTCGVGVHTHSASCYSAQSEAEGSMLEEADIYSTGEAESPALEEDIPALEEAGFPEPEKAAASLHFQQMLTDATSLYTLSGGTFAGETLDGDTSPEDMSSEDTPPGETLSGDTTTENELPDEGEVTETDEAVWVRVDENDIAEVHTADTVRLYYAYIIPAGTLDASNAEFRFPLPSNVHLTDEQIETNNSMNDGRGAQALEGTRTPDEAPTDPENVSAWVTFENVYDNTDDDTYEDIEAKSPALLEQDVVLTFDEYSIEKNRKTYDNDGALISDGEKINGFFSIDVTADQIRFDQNDENLEAQITLVEKDSELDIEPICRTLRLVEEDATEEEGSEEEVLEEKELEAEEAEGEKTEEETISEAVNDLEEASEAEERSNLEEETEEETGENLKGVTEEETESDSEKEQGAEADSNSEDETEAEAGENPEKAPEAGTLTFEGPDYTVSVTYTEDAGIPEGASLVVSEIREGSDEYNTYRAQAEDAIAAGGLSWIRLFDISIEVDGKPIEPNAPVAVQINYKEAIAQEQNTEVNTVHFEGTKETPKILDTEAEGTENTTEKVSFETDGFSVFAIIGTVIEKTVLASDGHNYRVTAAYGTDTGISDGAELAVEEITEGSSVYGKSYEEYVAYTENALGWEAGSSSYARVFDIKIVDKNDPEVKYQPKDGTSVDVRIELADAEKENDLNVVHFADADAEGDVVENSTENDEDGSAVEFAADGFSVYVIINHEGEETVVNPRVEFHFIAEDFTDDGTYTASPYNFVNTAGDYQYTQILKDGESLELITNPPNIVIDNGDGTNTEKFFYGWYMVNASGDTATLNSTTGKYEGDITYTWPASDNSAVSFEDNLVINDSGNIKVGDLVSWTLGDISGTGEIDREGRVHVYLAPLYEDFYFVNFRMGPKEDPTGLSNSLLARKMIVFGSGDTVMVRIGDVVCPSSDPQHKIFVGWETVVDNNGTLTRDTFYQTVDFDGNELDSPGSDDGYYIPVHKDTSTLTQVDLYPVFAESRWLKFNTGKSGNGAKYVGSAYRVTNDEGVGNYFDSTFFTGTGNNDSHLSSRAGYDFEGWYAFANMDSDGNITNLDEEQDVTISYLDEHGDKQTAAIRTKAVKMVNDDGSLAFEGPYTLNINGEDIKLFEVINGKLYFYKAMDDLTLFANWTEKLASYRVIVWKQKVTDDVDATDDEKEYDYEIFYTSVPADTGLEPDLTHFSGIYVDSDGVEHQVNNINLQNLANSQQSYLSDFDGFHYDRNNVEAVGNPNPDGTTVYNVYYDRNIHRLTFQVDDSGSGYNYTVTTGNNTPQYAFINGQFVQLSYRNGIWYVPEYGDVYTVDDTDGTYGLVNGEYVELTPVYSTIPTQTDVYKLTSVLTAGNDYLIVNSNTANAARYALSHSAATITTDQVTVNAGNAASGNVPYIYADDVDATSVWRVSGSYVFQNGSYYLRRNNNTLQISTTNSNNIWAWNSSNNRLTNNNNNNNRYLRFNNNSFSLSSTPSSVYLYVKDTMTENVQTLTGYTYDNNGTPVTYEGDHRYTKSYGETGEEEVFNGTRYTRSNLTNSWYTVYIIEALYGQNIANQFPIKGVNGTTYDNGERWDPQSNNLGWNEVMVIVDSMPDEDVGFRLNIATTRPLKTMNYYVQALPGETGDLTYNGVTYKLYTSVSARYNGVTSEDFLELDGFSKNGWSSNGSTSPYDSTFYIYNKDQDQTINFYYLREQSDLTFDVNYPVDANLVYSNGRSENLTVPDIYYQASLKEYGSSQVNGKTNWYYGVVDDNNTAQHELVGPDHYIFGGWYEDASCTVPFNFDSTMPAGNKIVYAKWEPEWFAMHIDPNGAEIDHINHADEFSRDAIPGERPADSGYDPSQSTYFWLSYGGVISEYSVARNYVPISEAAAEQYDGQIYYYMNHQYSHDLDGDFGLNANARNALFLTEEEIDQYYQHYADYAARAGVTVLDLDTWRQHYTSYGRQKYRIANGQEHYEFLGWYQVFNAGTEDEYLDDMPYVFTTPISNDLYLRAMWRLDGGYTIQYVPEYTMPDGAIINGEMENWNDPPTGNLTYSDGAATEIYKQPTDLIKNGSSIDDDSVIFLGWQLVSKSGTDDNPVYTPLEPGVYYDPSDPYTVNAADADSDSIIYFQAVYQYREASDRRPVVKNLTLDANTGYINTNDSADLPEWEYYPGTSAINTEDHLLGGNPTQIEFGDIQSSAAVHLYRYATELTEDAAGYAVTDANQFFEHPDGYLLLGFDDGPTEGDYVATYPADSVIAITRDENRTIYAVWEPMVYLTLKNETEVGPVTFNISSDSTEALEVINVRNGIYDRQPLSSLNNITLGTDEDNSVITLAFPKGAEKYITISGTNTLGVGNVLIWNSSIDLVEDGTTYDTAVSGQDVTYSHNEDESDTHTLVTGEVNNTKSFSFDERLIQNKNALTVTFTSRSNAYALVLDDNYPEGGIQEYDYSLEDISPDETGAKSQVLPSTSTRIGYEFQGWAYDKNAETPDFSASSPIPWTIPDLNADTGFFSKGTEIVDDTTIRTLYAVWKAKSEASHVYVYKEVPQPGNQTQEFAFTVHVSGTYKRPNYSTGQNIFADGTFTLAHGEYAELISSNSTTEGYIQTIVTLYNADGTRKTDSTGAVLSPITIKAQASNAQSGGTFNNTENISVTETSTAYYSTEMSRLAQVNSNYPLVLQDSSDIVTVPLNGIAGNTVTWTSTYAGGTVVYTNTRQTHDISVEKVLHSNTSAAAIFSFTASYTLDDGDPVDLGTFTVQSGTVNSDALKDIPAGAVLTLTEVTDTNDIYTTTTSSEKNAADLNDDAKIFRFTVSEDDTITFDNTLKSYPVTFRLVDQDGNTSINGMFSLSSSTGSLGTNLYASATSTNPPAGQFYSSDSFWADTYTLTQNIIPTSYIGPNGPVALTVTGSGIVSSDPENVTVTWKDPDDHSQGYLITVINRATKKVTVKKVLEDPLLANTRQFGFSYSYTPQDSEGQPTGEAVTGSFALSPVSNDTNGVTYELAVPIYASLTVSEQTMGDYTLVESTYDTVMTADGFTDSDADDGRVFTVSKVEDDGTITFTNTRKTQEVTVKKLFEDESDTTVVPFTVTVFNGSTAITGYTVFGTAEETGSLTTDENGQVTFDLAHNDTKTLTVPYGAKVVISEEAEGYTAAIRTERNTTDEDNDDNCFTMTVTQDDTVTFTNKKNGAPVILKKIGVDSATQQTISENLGGAEFTIYMEDHSTIAEGQVEEDGETKLSRLTSSDDTGVFFEGTLPTGTYYLHETGVPAGYYMLVDDLTMIVSADGEVEIFGQNGGETEAFAVEDGVTTVTIKNYSGYVLPSTGGPGTNLIYLLGSILTAFAGAGLVLRKRRRDAA